MWNFIVGRFQAAWDNIRTVGQMIVDGIKALFSIDWSVLGSNIIQGIIDGLEAGIQWVVDTAKKVADAVMDAVKGFLGISSPSTEFEKIAQMSIAGMVRGLQNVGSVQIAAQEIASTMLGAARPVTLAPATANSNQVVVNVYNPKPEPASNVGRELRRLSYLGAI